jgi:ribokinase
MEGTSPSLVVVGGTYVDLAIKCAEMPVLGKCLAGSALSYSVTGPGPNQAAQAALCGCRVQLISKIGGDPFGELVRQCLAEFNIDTTYVGVAEAKNTGTIVTMVNSAGENASLIYTGANGALQPADIEAAEEAIGQADVCLIHGRLPQQSIVAAIRCAKLHGTKVILNPARPLEHPEGTSEGLPDEYFWADVLVPNLYEAADITDHSQASIRTAKLIASDLLARGASAVVTTMGKRGCVVLDRQGAEHIPAFEVELLDHTATGDAFVGALAACCATGDGIRQGALFASAAGALACTKMGAMEAMPTRAEILQLLHERDHELP